jgi:hypothetical protein
MRGNKKRLATFAIAGAMSVGGLGLLSEAAVAGSYASAPIYQFKSDCSTADTAFPVIGGTTFLRSGNVVSVSYKLVGAPANTTFYGELYGNYCDYLGGFAVFSTDANGNGTMKFSVTVPAATTSFFATTYSYATGYNDTTRVTLVP